MTSKANRISSDSSVSQIDSVEDEIAEAVAAAIAARRAGHSAKDQQLKIEALSRRRKLYLRQRTRAFA